MILVDIILFVGGAAIGRCVIPWLIKEDLK